MSLCNIQFKIMILHERGNLLFRERYLFVEKFVISVKRFLKGATEILILLKKFIKKDWEL